MKTFFALVCAGVFCTAGSVRAVTLFHDDFSGEADSTILDYNAFQNFNIEDGTVDLVGTGNGFGIACETYPCVDLDGSTSDAGRMVSKQTFDFTAGVEYTMTVRFSGNQRSGFDQVAYGFIELGLGGDVENDFVAPVNLGDQFADFAYSFTYGSDVSRNIYISTFGDDNIGPILSSVKLEDDRPDPGVVPLPAGLPLLLAGLGVLGVTARKRRG